MDLTVDLTDAETKALRARAEVEGCSAEDVLRRAIRAYLERKEHEARVAAATADVVERHADVLRRLGE